jgi:hypothetical protein
VTLNDGLDCDCKEDGYNLMHESIIQAPLSTIWKQWFSFEKEGLFVQYLHTVQKITDLKFSNWVPEGQDDDECIPVEQVACNVAWDAVKPGMHRKSSRMVPLNHGMPFIPKQTVALNDFKVLHASESKLGVQNIANIVAVGIMTNLKYCFTQLNDQQTKFQLYGQIIFTGKGKFSVPQGILNSLVLAEKSTIQGVLTFYEQLKEFLALYLKVAPSASCSCLTMIDSDGYQPLVNTTMSMDIKSLWKSIFCVDPSGNLYTRTIFEKMKWTEVEFEPWRMKDEAEKELKAVEETNGDGFTIPFDSIQPLMKRRMHYSVPLNHSIPFGILY